MRETGNKRIILQPLSHHWLLSHYKERGRLSMTGYKNHPFDTFRGRMQKVGDNAQFKWKELAKRIGVGATAMSYFVNGKKCLPDEVAVENALTWLFQGNPDKYPRTRGVTSHKQIDDLLKLLRETYPYEILDMD